VQDQQNWSSLSLISVGRQQREAIVRIGRSPLLRSSEPSVLRVISCKIGARVIALSAVRTFYPPLLEGYRIQDHTLRVNCAQKHSIRFIAAPKRSVSSSGDISVSRLGRDNAYPAIRSSVSQPFLLPEYLVSGPKSLYVDRLSVKVRRRRIHPWRLLKSLQLRPFLSR
jgi:hypothetical protein